MAVHQPDRPAAEAHVLQSGPGGTAHERATTARAATADATAAQQGPTEQAELRPRGAMAATLLYLLVVAAAWGYMYFSLLRAGQGTP